MRRNETKTREVSHAGARALSLVEFVIIAATATALTGMLVVILSSVMSLPTKSATQAAAYQVGEILAKSPSSQGFQVSAYGASSQYPQELLSAITEALSSKEYHVVMNPPGSTTGQFALTGDLPDFDLPEGSVWVCNLDYSYCLQGDIYVTSGDRITFKVASIPDGATP